VVWGLAFAVLAAALPILAAGLVRGVRHRERRYCPGPVRRWWQWCLPGNLLTVTRCGYDLSGHIRMNPEPEAGDDDHACGEAEAARAATRCPECWRAIDNRWRLRTRPGGLRLVRLGLAGLIVSLSLFAWLLGAEEPVRTVPTWFLLRTEILLDEDAPEAFYPELYRRHGEKLLDQSEQLEFTTLLARQLRSDDTKWNAHQAMDRLSALKSVARPALEQALDADDWQQRQLAASLLRGLLRQNPSLAPSERLLEVTVEGLRDDALPWGENTMINNAEEGVRFLSTRCDVAWPYLLPALSSEDRQQRLLAAVVLGFGGREHYLDDVAPILIQQLRDNEVRGDALLALPALAGFGEAVVPHLERHFDDPDKQLRTAVRWLAWRLTPPGPDGERPPEPTRPRVSVRGPLAATPRSFRVPRLPPAGEE